jgi:predicted dehydrogenase
MPAELGAGIVGAGFMGTAHARAARLAGARLVGVAASTPDRGKEAAARLGADRAFASAQALVTDPEVDVVHLCAPNDLHAPLARTALEHGKHVVCEKPLTLDGASSDALVEAQRAAGTVGAVPFVYRFHPMARELRARVVAGDLGALHLVHGTYLQDWLADAGDDDWRLDPASGGRSRAFADIGSHWFDLVEFVTDQRVARLSARLARMFEDRRNEDTALVQFELDGGAVGSVVVSQVAPGRKNALVVECSGTGGSGRFDQEAPGSLWLGRREGSVVLSADPRLLAADAARQVVVPPGHPQGYLDCIDRFVVDCYAAIAGETPEGLPTFDDGRRAVHVVEAVLRSADAGAAWVEVAA